MKKEEFVPYIKDENSVSEITLTSVITGILLAVVFGAANAYLGLRVGMTVSASIPAAVVSMGVFRVILRKSSILESNLVQTVGSAGESVAAGAIFTLPALFLWASEGRMTKPGILSITLIALVGGILGVLFMIPLRDALIVKEHKKLPYPEGKACAEVLMAGEKKGVGTATVFKGMGFSAIIKFITDGLKIASGEVSFRLGSFPGTIGTQVYPAVVSVGYICGIKIASYMVAGGLLSSLVFTPLIATFGKDTVIYPGLVSIGEILNSGGTSAIWSTYIRYIGAGALITGGIISLLKTLPVILSTLKRVAGSFSVKTHSSVPRWEQSMDMRLVFVLILLITVFIWIIPQISVSFAGAVIIVIFGFLFAAVSSRMVGLVGSSNNPVSGMAIATLLITAVILKSLGGKATDVMRDAIAIGSVICIVSAISGDTSQDLKTGYILGATPRKQQIGEIIGVVASSAAIGGTLYLLDSAWGFGSEQLAAPQATLMKLIVEGVVEGNLPWALVITGAFTALVAEILGIPPLPFAIGIYLPVQLNVCIMAGALVRYVTEKFSKEEIRESNVSRGILFSSGMIAGEGIVGIILALLSILGVDKIFDLSQRFSLGNGFLNIGGIVVFTIVILGFFRQTLWHGNNDISD